MSNRTCKLCKTLMPVSLLSHKGQGKFHCKYEKLCLERAKSNDNLTDVVIETPTEETTQYLPENFDFSGYVITTVVKNAEIPEKLINNLEFYCQSNNYQLLVMEIDYELDGLVFPPVSDLLECRVLGKELVLNDSVRVLGDLQVSPTAVNPLSGLEPFTRGLTSIVPSTQLALKTIATIKEIRPIYLYGTGCISLPRYSDTKAGHKAKFHHSLSCIVVEFRNREHYIRTLPISNKDYSISDLGVSYNNNQTDKLGYSLVRGDIHVGYHSVLDDRAINKLVSHLGKIDTLILHDVFDGSSINHHELKNPFKGDKPFKSLQEELLANVDYLKSWANKANEVVIVDSNHHDFFVKWLNAVDWKCLKDTPNQNLYLLAALHKTANNDVNLYESLLNSLEQLPQSITFLDQDESYTIADNEVSIHGHIGSNGARGSTNTYNNLGYKTVTGHTHSPAINKSHYTVGCSTKMSMGYNKGLASWSNTHVLLFENNKRQMFTTYNGFYRG